jgi:hypothetical protein
MTAMAENQKLATISEMCRLCEFANVRNRAAQFLSLTGIFIALKPTFANRHYRHVAVIQEFVKRSFSVKLKGAGRIDWSNQFVGLIVNLFVALSLDPDRAAVLWQFWVQLLADSYCTKKISASQR